MNSFRAALAGEQAPGITFQRHAAQLRQKATVPHLRLGHFGAIPQRIIRRKKPVTEVGARSSAKPATSTTDGETATLGRRHTS